MTPDGGLNRRKWYKAVMAVAALVTAVFGAAEAVKKFVGPVLRPAPVSENTEIIMDRSAHMSGAFEGVTKVQAAAQAIGDVLQAQPSDGGTSNPGNLALRYAGGGPCGDRDTALALPFAVDNKARIRDAVAHATAAGKSSLAHAVIDAIADFGDSARFKGMNKRIVVITGGDDECTPGAIDAIKDFLRGRHDDDKVRLDFHFIGLALTKPQQDSVAELAQSVGGKVVFVDHRAELDAQLARLVVAPSAVAAVGSVMGLLNTISNDLTTVTSRVSDRGFPAATAALGEARKQFDATNASFDELGRRPGNEERVKKVYAMAADARSLQDRLLTIAERMVPEATAGNIEAYNTSAHEYEQVSSAFNAKTKEINQLLESWNTH
jgi:hypothetical protein